MKGRSKSRKAVVVAEGNEEDDENKPVENTSTRKRGVRHDDAAQHKKQSIFSVMKPEHQTVNELKLTSSVDVTEAGMYGDRAVVSPDNTLACVFDGFVRVGISEYCAAHITDCFDECVLSLMTEKMRTLSPDDIGRAFQTTRKRLFQQAAEAGVDCKSGTDMCCVYVHNRDCNPDPSVVGTTLFHYVACGVGLSQAYLSRNGQVVPLTPALTKKRPVNYRTSNDFDPSMYIYAFYSRLTFKRCIDVGNIESIARPQIDEECAIQITEGHWSEDEFIIIATDGLWGVFSPQSAVDFVHSQMALGGSSATSNASSRRSVMQAKSKIAW
jgi:serine/threonine protein phosphatase PrpC